MGQTSSQGKSVVVWGLVLVFVVVACVFAWRAQQTKLKEIEGQQMYLAGAEGFRILHTDAQIPLVPKNMTLVDAGGGKLTLEADGFQMTTKSRTPRRWMVHLVHSGSQWSVADSQWK